ncbi:carbohydrate ABC transporter membrane protein 1 (CUT1 family) [Lentzea atacamensis]|uniref:Carbohydrate ABC transporter membrane protein 1 (CUT1 family) n=1 Tax=Lentzea atacamensis TaxID=531938 RepID=A0A316HP01_9PSEU|nr:sugar ABC transporter permease [Lentzea atacamensis]PWK82312.1 carbohydrate ABC transporter membrane protein 1 (CUT1 family) [Lentzea atacamensis]RAS64599.1 carbohydrate ABC transporter membrane protein 1 (CUT1 family) [Lentzea atacamensis]
MTHRPYTPWLFLLPGLAISLLFVIFPFLNMIVLSFTDASALGGGRFTGVDNFVRMAQDPKFWVAARNSLLYMVGVVPPLVLLPLLIAMLAQKVVPGIGIFRTAFFTPVIASAVVVGLIWTWLLDSRGLVNNVVEALGGTRIGFLTDSTLLLISSMVVTIWRGLGYYMVIYLAALANVPKDLHEAAMVDGAGPIRRFWSVTVPSLRPTMVLVAALSAVNGFRVFSEIYLLSGGSGGPGGASTTMVLLIQSVGRGLTGEVGYASALSFVLFVILLGLLLVTLKLNRREDQL